MEGNKKKELIEEIVGQLRNHQLPYRKGAWEDFASKHGVTAPPSAAWKYWSAAAAVLLCFGLGYWGLRSNADLNSSSAVLTSNTEHQPILGDNNDLKESIQRSLSGVTPDQLLSPEELSFRKPFSSFRPGDLFEAQPKRQQDVLMGGTPLGTTQLLSPSEFTSLAAVKVRPLNSYALSAKIGLEQLPSEVSSKADLSAASKGLEEQSTRSLSVTPTQRDAAKLADLYASQQVKTKHTTGLHKLTKDQKWEMGAFVSPATTSESVTLGGGVALAYHISNKISIRSGASIQHYGAVSGAMPITPAIASNSFVAEAPNYISQNALSSPFVMRTAEAKEAKSNERISGKILTVDIPVDVRYAISKNFYTSVGVSYVGVLDQERAMIYETNNTAYKQQSTDKNVDDKGVNGFVNFSVGRKQQVGKLSISVEPYYKLPVGGLRSSDLNYSNGGVKIITSF